MFGDLRMREAGTREPTVTVRLSDHREHFHTVPQAVAWAWVHLRVLGPKDSVRVTDWLTGGGTEVRLTYSDTITHTRAQLVECVEATLEGVSCPHCAAAARFHVDALILNSAGHVRELGYGGVKDRWLDVQALVDGLWAQGWTHVRITHSGESHLLLAREVRTPGYRGPWADEGGGA